ncbi:iron complex outermembrane receptor protein [Sphingomonas kyeonggiensis]|uniref:TonB-dependent receptor plug domain-containing protein n=1 Tax=Sphingomonas kyeonggiensis TaxID=1268553 RepID=UPI002784446C|nr:TonB-dependent receptor [Sphingomonas kyeonggiensis]MDQ0251499.1 iron complex outermembrane receptor protein [Sphingomonas kyeonggiensis]
MKKTQIARLRTGAALSAFVLAGSLFAAPAFAQDTPAAATAPQTEAPASDGEIVVTGTIFRQSDTHTALPVTVITAENLERAGITNVTDAIRSASADGAGSIGNGFTSGFSAGGAAVSLRNLGVSSTLILVDGLRSTNFPLSDDGHNSYVDLNSIPMVNVQQVQVLKDGASSLYGADAIGGVVNIITRKTMTGLEAGIEGGATEKGDGAKYRAKLLFGYGDYDTQGFNIYVGGDYEYGGRISAASRGFPFDTLDLRGIGGNDNNRADDTLGTATTDAVVTRVTQTDLNNPLAGSVANATSPAIFTSLTPLANCTYGTYSENGTRVGTACKHDNTREYAQVTPLQERYDAVARLSFRVGSNVEGYVAGSFAHSRVDIISPPRAIRQTQAFGGAPSTSTTNPGIVLPVYICSSGINCATAADRQLNPNNPYAAAYALNPAAGAARLYYLFGDVRSGSERINEVYRVTGGLHGTIADTWDWNVEAGYSRADLNLTQYGWANLNGLIKAINTGSYNFVNPSLNTAAVRNSVLPPITARSNSSELTVDASISRSLFALPGGDVRLAVGGQYRKEKLTNNSANPNLDIPGLSTAQAYGDRSVWAGFFEVDVPVLDSLNVDLSGRYDHYSTGIGRFSPKATAKFQPIKQLAIRGTYSEGFRAPTFAESDPRSSYSGFVGYTPTGAFVTAHAANPTYIAPYSLGRGYVGNSAIKPETSRSFTLGAIFEPTPWLSFTADYFNVKKSNLIVTGPKTPDAINAYYSVAGQTFPNAAAAAAAGCAAVAAVGTGYSCNVVDGADPFAPNALPRLLVVNAPYVNTAYMVIAGLEFTADARIKFSEDFRWESRVDVQETLKYDLHPGGGQPVQRYAGTVGPEDLSSGGGTPRWRGNWQNTFTYNQFSLSTTTYYVGSIKAVAADQASSINGDISCASAIYKPTTGSASFCHINSFIYTDVNLTVKVNDKFSFFGLVGNVTNSHAPLFANTAYPSQVNTLTSWHSAGLIGRTFRAGANIKF